MLRQASALDFVLFCGWRLFGGEIVDSTIDHRIDEALAHPLHVAKIWRETSSDSYTWRRVLAGDRVGLSLRRNLYVLHVIILPRQPLIPLIHRNRRNLPFYYFISTDAITVQ